MSGAGEGDSRGLRSGPEPVEPDRAEDVATQMLPTVSRSTSDDPKPQVVRAVARRAAAALPALGGEGGGPPIPKSARATVDRRRRAARETAKAQPEGTDQDETQPEETDQDETQPEETAPEEIHSDESNAGDTRSGENLAPDRLPEADTGNADPEGGADPGPADAGPADAGPDNAGPADPGVGARDASGADPDAGTDPAGDGSADADSGGADMAPLPSAGPPDGPPPEPALGQPQPVTARHLREEGGSPGRGLVPVGVPAAAADDWSAASQATVALATLDDPASGDSAGGPRLGGPSVLEADSWDADADTGSHSDSYHGRRRAQSPRSRVWLLVGLVVTVLVGVVTAPFLFRGTTTSEEPPPSSPEPIAIGVSPTGELAATSSPPAGPTPSPKPVRTTEAAPPPPPPPTTEQATVTAPAFEPLTLEAEAASYDSWQHVNDPDCGGGSAGSDAVRVGRWELGRDVRVGELTFTDVAVPVAGQYTLTAHYLTSGGGSREVHISVNGEPGPSGNWPPGCVGTRQVTVSLAAGTNTITFRNETSRAPTIDKIVITQGS